MRRKQISTRTRFEIFKRDGFACQYCGATPPKVLLHVDHVVAVANGGTSDRDNIVTACETCNLGKAAVPLESVPQSLSEQATQVAERERQLRGYHEVMEAKRQRLEGEQWEIAGALTGRVVDTFSRGYLRSIKMFLERIPFHVVLDAAESALNRFPGSEGRKFRYFCGICWAKVRDGNGSDGA